MSNRMANTKEKIQDSLASMNPRDRMIYVSIFFIALFSIFIAGVMYMNNSLNKMEQKISTAQQDLQNINKLMEELGSLMAQSSEIETQIKKHENTDLSAFLESSAQKSGIKDKLDSVREKSASSDEILQEKTYAVRLKNLELSEFSKFLFEVETSGYPLQIQSCTIKTKKKRDEKTLTVNMDIAAYRFPKGEK